MTDDQRARRGDVYVRLVTGLVIGGVVLAARWYWNQLVAAHVPYVDYDTQVFTQIADRPLGGGLLFAPKPLVVPLVYRLAGNDPGRVVGFQDALAFVSWSLVAVILALGRRRLWVRPIAAAIGMAFVFAPTRVGFTASLMPESIDDSLLALTVASALALGCLRGRSRAAAMVAMGLFAAIWMLTRDTNVFIALAAVVVAMIVWRGWRARRVWLAAACVIGAAAGVLATTCVAHEPLPYQHDWYARFTPRGVYPLLDNVTIRVDDLRDQLPAELASSADRTIQVEWLVRAAPRPLQDWFVDRGGGVYARWLVRHPIDRVGELVEARWTVLASSLATYMPKGWVSGGGWLRRLTRQHTVLLVLVLAAPLLLLRPRTDPTCGVALVMIASGVVGVAASYYGDAAEVARHCYGAGQQVVLGLFVALIAWLDRARWSAVVSLRALRQLVTSRRSTSACAIEATSPITTSTGRSVSITASHDASRR